MFNINETTKQKEESLQTILLDFFRKEEETIDLDLRDKIIEKVKEKDKWVSGITIIKTIPYTNQKGEKYLIVGSKKPNYTGLNCAVRLINYKFATDGTEELKIVSLERFPDHGSVFSSEAEALKKVEDVKIKLQTDNLLEILTEKSSQIDINIKEKDLQIVNLKKETENFQIIIKEKNKMEETNKTVINKLNEELTVAKQKINELEKQLAGVQGKLEITKTSEKQTMVFNLSNTNTSQQTTQQTTTTTATATAEATSSSTPVASEEAKKTPGQKINEGFKLIGQGAYECVIEEATNKVPFLSSFKK
jgi:hypothetical protein